MKKILSILILMGSLLVVGCKSKEITVTFEDYGIYDIDKGADTTERITVSIEGNEISKSDINQILEQLENKNMNTELIITNVQGSEIAEVKERDEKIVIEIKDGYESKETSEIQMKGLDIYKEYVNIVRGKMEKLLVDRLDEYIENYKGIGESINKIIDDMPAKTASILVGKKGMDLDAIKKHSKDFLGADEVKSRYDKLMESHAKYLKSIKLAETYMKDEKTEDLEKFKKSAMEYIEFVK